MPDVGIEIKCLRCGTAMDMVDPAPGADWRPDQFWTCPRCGRHFWTTYPSAPGASAKAAAPAAE
jgi:hypothetical protein